jgi:hypothetical protein
MNRIADMFTLTGQPILLIVDDKMGPPGRYDHTPKRRTPWTHRARAAVVRTLLLLAALLSPDAPARHGEQPAAAETA